MRKTILVALRDYKAAVKTKAFAIGLLMMPLMFGGGILFQIVFRNNNDIRDKRVAVVDYTGQLFAGINQASNIRNQALIYDGESAARKQIQPRYIIEKADPGTNDSAHMALALSDRVRKKELFAFVIISRMRWNPAATLPSVWSSITPKAPPTIRSNSGLRDQ